MGPEALAHVLRPLADIFTPEAYPQLLVGLTAPDDAAVYRLADDLAIVSTTDFFPPVVDDPYAFGAIAAANALSDIYAMGGEPLFALNLAAFPDDLPAEVMTEIFRGGAEKVREAGAVIAGGHTVTDKEPKYGLAVTGRIDPRRILAKQGIRPGDRLVLTKALGTGVITTAHKRDQVAPDDLAAAVASMVHLNRAAAAAASAVGVHALTDITGFGLLGHAHEMTHLSGVRLTLDFGALPWLPGARSYAEAGIFPGGTGRNCDYFGQWVRFDQTPPDWEVWLLHDPQTSGGLLMAVAEADLTALLARLRAEGEAAWVIGTAEAGAAGEIIVR
jgi:selenide, water dikinase